jgi:alpha-mannosidase
VVTSCGFHDGELPSALSLVNLETKNVRLVALKKAQVSTSGERETAIVLRLVEVEGRKTEARLALAPELLPAAATAIEVDTLERPLDTSGARLAGGTLVVSLPAFGIATVRIG